MNHCDNCNKECEHNYCDWQCHIEAAKKEGGKVICPNGLPITCIMANWDMLEHADANHPDYKFPVEIEFVGTKPADAPDWEYSNESHALIYCDVSVALTIYECCYELWRMRDGLPAGRGGRGTLYSKEWRMTEASRKKILDQFKR